MGLCADPTAVERRPPGPPQRSRSAARGARRPSRRRRPPPVSRSRSAASSPPSGPTTASHSPPSGRRPISATRDARPGRPPPRPGGRERRDVDRLVDLGQPGPAALHRGLAGDAPQPRAWPLRTRSPSQRTTDGRCGTGGCGRRPSSVRPDTTCLGLRPFAERERDRERGREHRLACSVAVGHERECSRRAPGHDVAHATRRCRRPRSPARPPGAGARAGGGDRPRRRRARRRRASSTNTWAAAPADGGERSRRRGSGSHHYWNADFNRAKTPFDGGATASPRSSASRWSSSASSSSSLVGTSTSTRTSRSPRPRPRNDGHARALEPEQLRRAGSPAGTVSACGPSSVSISSSVPSAACARPMRRTWSRSSPWRSNCGCGATRMVTYRSPGGPPRARRRRDPRAAGACRRRPRRARRRRSCARP